MTSLHDFFHDYITLIWITSTLHPYTVPDHVQIALNGLSRLQSQSDVPLMRVSRHDYIF